MAKPKKLSQQELIDLILDPETPEELIAQYVILDEEGSGAFAPVVVPNPELVEDNGLEGAFLLNSFNRLARARRNRIYRKRIKDWNGVRVVAEGDSWFQYPLRLKDTIDQLIDLDQFQYAIYGLSEAGDLLSNIVREDEITEAIERENPDVFLISGGGNDMVGDNRMATLVNRHSRNRKPENYPNAKFDQFLDELRTLYRGLFARLLTRWPHLKILCHGYDNAIPQNGNWLGKPLKSRGIESKTLQRQIVAVMIGRFNEALIEIAGEFPGAVYHVDCRDVVGATGEWFDELHPRNAGYLRVAEKFDATMREALSTETRGRLGAPDVPAGSAPKVELATAQKLDHNDFLNLVVKRAELTMGKQVKRPESRYERKQLEKDISEYFEKIHKDANFLPSSFLEKGVESAQSVCRITTDTSYGSGFLIGSRQFIMTNNHVLPDRATAAASHAQFDYDDDNVEYRVELRPDQLFITDQALDFTIVACDPAPLPTSIEAIPLLRDPHTITRGERANIVQHPAGRRKEVSLHDNKVTYVYDSVIRYTADTEGGSSGSPVFNNQWNLVALHHAGWRGADGSASNEGIRIKAIVDFLIARSDEESSERLEELIGCVADGDGVAGPGSTPVARPAAVNPPARTGRRKSMTIQVEGELEELTVRIL